jgi:hypothetical protein
MLATAPLEQRSARRERALVQADPSYGGGASRAPVARAPTPAENPCSNRAGACDPRTERRRCWLSEAVLEADGERGLGPVVAMVALKRLRDRLGRAGELMVAALVDSPLASEIRGALDAEFPRNKGDLLIVVDASLTPGLGVRLSEFCIAFDRLSLRIPIRRPAFRATERPVALRWRCERIFARSSFGAS